MTVYQAKTAKNVLLLGTMYSTDVTDDGQKSNPESVEFYNFIKCGVDQMARKYTVNATSRRWPLQFFNNIRLLSVLTFYIS